MNKSRALASLLLTVVVVTHYLYDPMASFYADHGAAARAIFYILRGVEGTILYAVVWALSPRSAGIALACGWGMLESAQTAVCRAVAGVAAPQSVGAYSGLCDAVTGLPVYGLTLAAALVVASLVQTNEGK